MKHLLRTNILLPVFFFLSIFVFLAHTAYTKTAIFADGKFYYAFTRSVVLDFDLNFANEYDALNIQKNLASNTKTINPYPPGTSIFWLPLFYLTNGFVRTIKLISNIDIGDNGYGFLPQSSVALSSIFLGISGLYLVYLTLKKFFTEQISLLATLILFTGTNLFFYIAVEPINSHAVSFFVSALFIYYFLDRENDKNYYLVLGLLTGIAGLVRTQDALLLVLPAIKILFRNGSALKNLATSCILLASGLLIGFLPQILLWKYFYNTFWYSPYFAVGFNFLKPHILSVLFNTQNGLFVITPVILMACIGLMFMKSKYYPFYFYILLYFILQLYLVSSWNSTIGGSFGNRMMITTYPLLTFGLATILEKTVNRFGEVQTLTIITFFSALNFLLILRYLLRF